MREISGHEAIELAKKWGINVYVWDDKEVEKLSWWRWVDAITSECTPDDALKAIESGIDPDNFFIGYAPETMEEAKQIVVEILKKCLLEEGSTRFSDVFITDDLNSDIAVIAAEELVKEGKLIKDGDDYILPGDIMIPRELSKELGWLFRDGLVCDDCQRDRLRRMGVNSNIDSTDSLAKLNSIARSYVDENEGNLSYEKAFAMASRNHPDLYKKHREEVREREKRMQGEVDLFVHRACLERAEKKLEVRLEKIRELLQFMTGN